MKKIALFTAVAGFALVVSACGDSGDASEDAMADNVEMPADDAMAGMPDPTADTVADAAEEATQSAEEALDAADAAGAAAEEAAADAAAAAEAANEAAGN